MTLRIIKSADPITVERLNLCIYSPPGLGKTTMGFSAAEPLNFDFDKGAHRAANRKDIVPVTCWGDAVDISAEEVAPYKTIVVDTAGRALDFLTADIIRENPKMGRGGALTLQGYGVLKVRFAAWLKMLNTFGKDVVLIAHMDEQRSGDDIVERLDVQGGSKGEIYKSVDAMGRIFVRETGNPPKLERVLDFSPRANSFGKNPAGLEVIPVPDPTSNNHFLADVIAQIKDKMNALTEEQKQQLEVCDVWARAIEKMVTLEEVNKFLPDIKQAPKTSQLLFSMKAKGLGFTFNKNGEVYESHA